MTDYTNVAARAVLASLHVSVWSAQRFDRAVSDEVNERKDADKSSGRFNKHLFGTRRAGRGIAPEFFAVHDAADRLRTLHDAETLPWGKRDGERLLPVENYFIYTERLRKAGSEFRNAVDAFVEAYPRLQVAAQERLGKLYLPDDFLAQKDIRSRFDYRIAIDPVPTGVGDFRVDLPADQIAAIEADVASRIEGATREAMLDAWGRLQEAVGRILKASKEDGIVRDNLIQHAEEVCDVLGRLNVAGDEQLDAMRARVQRELTGIAVEDLRKDKRLRADTEQRAAEIMAAMSGLYAPATRHVA